MRVALVHDWLLGMRGGERCLEVLCEMFPDADIYTAFYDPKGVTPTIRRHRVGVSVLGKLPNVRKYYRWLMPLFPLASRSLSKAIAVRHEQQPYDLVISVSHCLAKNISVPRDVPHLCYCLTPVRYFWDHFESYFEGRAIEPLASLVVRALRSWDLRGARRVSRFLGISDYIVNRIQRIYGEPAGVVYPPVRTDWITPRQHDCEGKGFLCVSALVPYKNVDLVIEAFSELPYDLTIIGDGPERERLESLAKQKLGKGEIRFVTRVSDEELAEAYRDALALVFAAEEDFGMVPVEMQAAGRPVIAFGRGGALETVEAGAAASGIYFSELTVASLRAAIEDFNVRQDDFTLENCIAKARQFDLERFQKAFFAEVCGLGFSARELAGQSEVLDGLLSSPEMSRVADDESMTVGAR